MKLYCERCYRIWNEDLQAFECPHVELETTTLAIRADGTERVCGSKDEADAFLTVPVKVAKGFGRPARGEVQIYFKRGGEMSPPVELQHGVRLVTASGQVVVVHLPLWQRVKRFWRRVAWRWNGILAALRGEP